MIKNNLNAHQFEKKYEVNTKPSMTVPGHAMTVEELISRHSRGLDIGQGKVPVYDEDDDMPDPRHMDLADRESLARQIREELKPKPQTTPPADIPEPAKQPAASE